MGISREGILVGQAAREPHIELDGVCKRYAEVAVLDRLSLGVQAGDFVAIGGMSGSGKTTLLGIIGLLETPTSGSYKLQGRPVEDLDDAARSRLRNQTFGFVFQQFSLIPNLSAWQNVARPLHYARVPKREQKARALELLERLGLAHRAHHRPAQLSGGEQQRVAIARAPVNDPDIILADEPTGNLPRAQWEPILAGLEALNSAGKTIVLSTHNPEVAARASTSFQLREGRLYAVRGLELGAPAFYLGTERTTLRLLFLGRAEAWDEREPLPLTPRQADILALLAQHPEGLSGESLLLLVYGEKGKMSTLKAALSRLRRHIPIASQPYRLETAYQTDFELVEALLREGKLQEALEHYRGPLLPRSSAPGVAELRERLEETLRRAVIARRDAGLLLMLAERVDDDLELWEAALAALSPEDPRRAAVLARMAHIKKTW